MSDKNIYVNKKVSKIVKGTIIAILLGILITFAVSLIAGYKYKFVVTSSMEPVYKTKSCIIVVAPCDYSKDVKIGDVITWGGKTTFTHRVVGQIKSVEGDEFTWVDKDGLSHIGSTITFSGAKVGRWIARGDNPEIREDQIQVVGESNFVGRVVYHSNFIGAIVNYIQTNLFLTVFCMIVIFVCCMIFL